MFRRTPIHIFALATAGFCALAGTTQQADHPQQLKATFAGGCFWSMELAFHQVPGVLTVAAGYTGGSVVKPSYDQVSSGTTGHVEAIQITFDPKVISYEKLLDFFWRHVDPLDAIGQFCDHGPEYRSQIFVHDEQQRQLAETSRNAIAASGRLGKPIVTQITRATEFYPAESYHQDYARKNPLRYGLYRSACGRDRRLAELWKPREDKMDDKKETKRISWRDSNYHPPDKSQLKRDLSPQQFHVTQEEGTEAPFRNEYHDNHQTGIYVDVVSGEPLFSSTDKFDSGTGWPSFARPLETNNVKEKIDRGLFTIRTEVRSAHANSHLGHVFNDGPRPTGLRYCINSAALRFVPASKLAEEGYPEYLKLFELSPQASSAKSSTGGDGSVARETK